MADYRQYRITFQGATGPIIDEYPGNRWVEVSRVHQERGGRAVLEYRLVTDASILPMLTDRTGYIELPNGLVLSPWEILAELPDRPSRVILIG